MELTRREVVIAAATTAATLALGSLAPRAQARTREAAAVDPFAADELPLAGLAGECSCGMTRTARPPFSR